MNKSLIIFGLLVLIAGCGSESKVRFERGKKAPAGVQTQSRSEPIFYNGKTYQLDYNYVQSAGAFNMRVAGLGPNQKQDATNIATSALAYYSCPNGSRGKTTTTPSYSDNLWHLQAKCG